MCILFDADSVPADTGGLVDMSFGPNVGFLELIDGETYNLEFLRAVKDPFGTVQLVSPQKTMFDVDFVYVEGGVMQIQVPPLPAGCEYIARPWVSDNPAGFGPEFFPTFSMDIAWSGPSDCNDNGIIDVCDIVIGTSLDCNVNGIPDECEIATGASHDCNANGIPDECDIANGASLDCNANGIPDECDIASGFSFDCNANGIPDECDIANGASLDCNVNGVPDECDIASGASFDCNGNGVPDECDIASGASLDCNGNGFPDECDIESGVSLDCNLNGVPDECDIAFGASSDCNLNGIPDECDIATGASLDCNVNGVPDECDIASGASFDCNDNGVPDECDISSGFSLDCNGNGIPDECDIALGVSIDCNANGIPDDCDIADGSSLDCNSNGIPDDCEVDCNGNGVPDDCDIAIGASLDCNANGIPDECDVASGFSLDCNANGVPDECDIASGFSLDCNVNGVPDECDIANGISFDCNGNGVPDECDIGSGASLDCNGNGIPDECDIAGGVSLDCNGNGVPDDCDIASGSSLDCNGNGTPDECDIESGVSADVNQNGIIDDCEPLIAAVTPPQGPSALGTTVALDLPNIPDGPAELWLNLGTTIATIQTPGGPSIDIEVPIEVAVPIAVFGETSTVDLPPLQFASASDVTADATVRWIEGSVESETDSLPNAFTFEVPQVVAVTPNAVPFDGLTPIVIELADNVLSSGVGQVWVGDATPQVGNFFEIAGTTYVATNAPPQPAPGDYPIELEITSGGVTEFTRVESRALVYLGPGINSISAIEGFQGGGEPVTFELVDFQPGVPVEVAFGDAVTSGVPTGFLAASTLTVFTPTSPVAGVVDVTLTQDLGGGAVKTVASPSAFEFLPPTVGELTVTSGPQAGGDFVTASTDGFATGSITVEMGGVTTTGVVSGVGTAQTVDWTTAAAAVAGVTDVRLTQGVFDVTLVDAYEYLAPSMLSISPNSLAWYDAATLSLTGTNFAASVPAEVTFEGQAPLPAWVVSDTEVQVSVLSQELIGSGPVDVTVSQAGVDAVLADGLEITPSLSASLTGNAADGGSVELQVASKQGGLAYLLVADSPSPIPLPFTGIHGALGLDPSSVSILVTGGLQITPTAFLPFGPGLLPQGIAPAIQALAIEAGAQGIFYSFTNVETVVIP
ncbi:MAG: IPT/TIG domain-containing protein [Planctomycetota bacterium]|jgi:hypothetical protein